MLLSNLLMINIYEQSHLTYQLKHFCHCGHIILNFALQSLHKCLSNSKISLIVYWNIQYHYLGTMISISIVKLLASISQYSFILQPDWSKFFWNILVIVLKIVSSIIYEEPSTHLYHNKINSKSTILDIIFIVAFYPTLWKQVGFNKTT